MPAAGYVVVSAQPSLADAELLAGLLRSGGMPVLVEGADDAEYPAAVAGGYRITVPAERAAEAQQLLVRAEHVDPTDPASSLDVGLPVDEDVRDYLAWKGGQDVGSGEPPVETAAASVSLPEIHAPRLPLLPLLSLVALVVAVVLLIRH